MKKILFLHGFYASGQCVPAMALREAFEGRAEVITPDLPMHPKEAVRFIRELIEAEKPDLLIGNSCGAFYAQMVAPVVGVPALLGNPHFRMTEFLKHRIGEHQYKSPRKDGKQNFVIDEALIEEFAEMEAIQFDNCHPDYNDRIWGLFGEQDTLAHFEPLFLQHYNRSFHFSGGHTPTAEEVCDWYVPLAEKMLEQKKTTDGAASVIANSFADCRIVSDVDRRSTPEFITELQPNEIFVFGSNLKGMHGGGAAYIAYHKFGAIMGQGVGLQGQSYAIPTMQGGVETIKPYVDEFIQFAKKHPELTFLVTRIGCGIAGFTDDEISPLFETAHDVENIVLPPNW